MRKERTMLKTAALLPNTGQLDWLPKNPRQWTKEDVARTVVSIEEDTDFLEDRPLLVTPKGGSKWVVFAGNLRHAAAKEMGLETVPCVAYYPETEDDQLTIKRRAMKDNGSFGSWDYDELANAWDDLPLAEWGIDVPEMQIEEEDEEVDKKKEKIDEVERLLDEAMRENVKESIEQIEHGLKRGWLSTFLTKGLAQAKFIKAKYYGEHYPQWMSLYFCPERLMTSANKKSPWEQMNLIAKGETDAGIAGLRTLSGDHLLLLLLLKGSYPFGSARMPMDFPANVARHLIEEFGGTGTRVLDPCHGWGGRLCGALMADAALYVGVDPSDEAHAGVEKEAEAFLPYCEGSKVELIKAPYEDTRLDKYGLFDVAITSPPYFDVEQYHGEGQAHIRYPQFEGWVSGFYRPMIEKTYDALKPNGVFCLQVGSKSYPLLSRGVEIAKKTGFTVEDIRPLGGGTESALHNGDAEDEENEKIIILRK